MPKVSSKPSTPTGARRGPKPREIEIRVIPSENRLDLDELARTIARLVVDRWTKAEGSPRK